MLYARAFSPNTAAGKVGICPLIMPMVSFVHPSGVADSPLARYNEPFVCPWLKDILGTLQFHPKILTNESAMDLKNILAKHVLFC